MVGGYVLGLLEAYVKGSSLTTWANPIVFGVLILILIFRPNGLFGKNVKEKVEGGKGGNMENNANSSNQTVKTENTEYKWQKLNYFNKFKIKNYILTLCQ